MVGTRSTSCCTEASFLLIRTRRARPPRRVRALADLLLLCVVDVVVVVLCCSVQEDPPGQTWFVDASRRGWPFLLFCACVLVVVGALCYADEGCVFTWEQ